MNSREIESWGMKERWLHKGGDRYKQRSDMKVGGERKRREWRENKRWTKEKKRDMVRDRKDTTKKKKWEEQVER